MRKPRILAMEKARLELLRKTGQLYKIDKKSKRIVRISELKGEKNE